MRFIGFVADAGPVYVGTTANSRQFVVAGNEESDAYLMNRQVAATIAPERRRVGWIGAIGSPTGSPQGARCVVVVDGKSSAPKAPCATDLTFSPDGSRFAYLSAGAVAVGGAEDAAIRPWRFTNVGGGAQALPFLFSPDGKHFTCFGAPLTPPPNLRITPPDDTSVDTMLAEWRCAR